MASQIYLITGANRGIGRGLVEALIQRPSTVVIAAVRNPSHETSRSLSSLTKAPDSKVIVTKLDLGVDGDDAALETVKALTSSHPEIDHLDVVIANAGISDHYLPAASVSLAKLRSHWEVHALAPLALFQASWPLLQKSSNPKFVAISSPFGSIGMMKDMPVPNTVYGSSKAALNFIVTKIHHENEATGLIAFALSPGWVQTAMGDHLAKFSGQENAPMTLDQSIPGVLNVIDTATRDETSGHFRSFDGKDFPW